MGRRQQHPGAESVSPPADGADSGPWTPRFAFRRGVIDCAPFVLIVVPFAMMFGAVARDAGLDVLQVMSMAVLVIAGASQFAALALLQEQAPLFIALFTALAVNLRMAMYSAALAPHIGHAPLGLRALLAYLMVDQAFAVAVRTYEDHPTLSKPAKVAYYIGCVTLSCPLWYGGALLGALIGDAVPASLSLEFAVPICFIALTAPLLRSAAHVAAALASILGAILFAWLPWSLGLLVAAGFAMAVGAQTELYLARRAAR